MLAASDRRLKLLRTHYQARGLPDQPALGLRQSGHAAEIGAEAVEQPLESDRADGAAVHAVKQTVRKPFPHGFGALSSPLIGRMLDTIGAEITKGEIMQCLSVSTAVYFSLCQSNNAAS